MDKAHAQAQATRKSNLEKRLEAHRQKMAELGSMKDALKAVAADKTATPSERLEAVKLMIELERV